MGREPKVAVYRQYIVKVSMEREKRALSASISFAPEIE